MPCSYRPRWDLHARPLRHLGAAFRSFNGVGSHEQYFRGSVTRPARSLSTLRRRGHPTSTQDSLPAAGQLCRAGLATRRVPMRGFKSSYPPRPGFAWRNERLQFGYWDAPDFLVDRPTWLGTGVSIGPRGAYDAQGLWTERTDASAQYIVTRSLMLPNGPFPRSRLTVDELMSIGYQVWQHGQSANSKNRFMPVVLPDKGVIWVGAQRFPNTSAISSVFPFWDDLTDQNGCGRCKLKITPWPESEV